MENILIKLIKESEEALSHGDIPVSAALLDENDNIISISHNTKFKNSDLSQHAEINVMNTIFKDNNDNLSDYKIITTLEPCGMCYWAIKHAKINKIYYLLDNEKFGFKNHLSVNDVSVDCVKISNEKLEKKYKKILENTFKELRNTN
ncbi:nucleoside deaminase [Mesoplasma photuris]|uniref:nucleoside deaminase n=1 Tax=Mesoplasma photuris TaxID=217731 RepID=UPI0004E26D98|nr:nucleoside deaminase [Mesoplasma photuris]